RRVRPPLDVGPQPHLVVVDRLEPLLQVGQVALGGASWLRRSTACCSDSLTFGTVTRLAKKTRTTRSSVVARASWVHRMCSSTTCCSTDLPAGTFTSKGYTARHCSDGLAGATSLQSFRTGCSAIKVRSCRERLVIV